MTGYAELCITSNFTFLTGASHPEELASRAALLGLDAFALTDRNSLAGVVRAHVALREIARLQAEEVAQATVPIRSEQVTDTCSRLPIGARQGTPGPGLAPLPRLVIGSRIVLADSPVHWLAYPEDRAAHGRLCRLLSLGRRRAGKGACHLEEADLAAWAEGLVLVALPPDDAGAERIAPLAERFPGQVHLGAAPRYDGLDDRRLATRAGLAERLGLPMVALGDVLLHHGSRRPLADVLTCIRERCTIDSLGLRALPNAERRLRAPAEMARLFRDHPEALARTREIAARCRFSLDELRHSYPHEATESETAEARLVRLTGDGIRRRWPAGMPQELQARLDKEFDLIADQGYAPYFLTVHDIVAFARSRGILAQGRGSAANSLVCYALGITEVPPDRITMVFERFISRERGEPPDIDVDFEHERREEVIQWIYGKYGRDHAGLTATVIHFRTRAAIREVGGAMGLSRDAVARLAGQVWGPAETPVAARLTAAGLDPADARFRLTLRLITEIIGFPRHLSQHVGGFVITQDRLDEIVPIENAAMADRTVIEWDKDDIDALGLLKVDILALGMLTCLRKGLDLLADHGGPRLTLPTIPPEEAPVYDMLCRADAIGVFQVESRAQMNFLPRMRPRKFYDLVIEVAIVRPGPIQGGMVHPYLRRRLGQEPVEDLGPALNGLLAKTMGVPLFQEQAMQIAVLGAGFDPGEADRLRRSLATFRRMGTISTFRERFLRGMAANGYAADFAERCFSQIEGFGEYGFPESHAASFAILVYASAWLKCYHPVVFACALLNSQPMGFYAPAQIVRDLRDHGLEVRPVSVNDSAWDCTLEPAANGLALRLGFRLVKGLGQDTAEAILRARGNGYPDVASLWRRTGAPVRALADLAGADAFAPLGLARRAALWQVKALGSRPLPLFEAAGGEEIPEPMVTLPALTPGEEVVADYVSTRLSLRAHPMALLRPAFPGTTAHAALAEAPARVTVCGIVITRQRPGTASGVIFLTLEDETGVANVVVWRRVFERFRPAVLAARLLRVSGRLEREGMVVHLIAEELADVSATLSSLGHPVPPHPEPHPPPARHPRDQAKAIFPSRDFH